VTGATLTVSGRGWVTCESCALVCQPQTMQAPGYCPRCGQGLHRRKLHSVARSWAYLIAAVILYVPANLEPVLYLHSLYSQDEPNTILQGVISLWTTGQWPLALLVFFASIVVPLLKLFSLVVLLVTAQRKSQRRLLQRAHLYRLIESIGRWSMLDVYVVALLVALVQLDRVATVRAGDGAIYFGAVVVLTLLATGSFDPRLTWDALEGAHERRG
jgi:paraquat-inducible protein A